MIIIRSNHMCISYVAVFYGHVSRMHSMTSRCLRAIFSWSFLFVVVVVVVQRLCEEGGHKGDLKGAWIAIAECLPDRTIQVTRLSTIENQR